MFACVCVGAGGGGGGGMIHNTVVAKRVIKFWKKNVVIH